MFKLKRIDGKYYLEYNGKVLIFNSFAMVLGYIYGVTYDK